MARTGTSNMKTAGTNYLEIKGSFLPDTANTPTGLVGKGIASVAHTATGVFTVTLSDKYSGWVSGHTSLQMASATNIASQFGAIDVVTAKTIVIRTYTPGTNTAVDIAADAANRVCFSITVKQSTL